MITFSEQIPAISNSLSEIETAITTYDSTFGEPAKLDLATEELHPLLLAKLGLFNQVAPAFIQQTVEAASKAIRPWITDAHTRERIINDYFGIREIHLAVGSVERSIHNPSAVIAGLRSMALVFNRLVSAPQNQP
jgi:hypothetical protein